MVAVMVTAMVMVMAMVIAIKLERKQVMHYIKDRDSVAKSLMQQL